MECRVRSLQGGRGGWAARFYALARTDPGRVISMSIAIANTFSRTMGISFHLLFCLPAPSSRRGVSRIAFRGMSRR